MSLKQLGYIPRVPGIETPPPSNLIKDSGAGDLSSFPASEGSLGPQAEVTIPNSGMTETFFLTKGKESQAPLSPLSPRS